MGSINSLYFFKQMQLKMGVKMLTHVSVFYLQPENDPYAFVEFAEHSYAASGLMAMNKRMCMGRVSPLLLS